MAGLPRPSVDDGTPPPPDDDMDMPPPPNQSNLDQDDSIPDPPPPPTWSSAIQRQSSGSNYSPRKGSPRKITKLKLSGNASSDSDYNYSNNTPTTTLVLGNTTSGHRPKSPRADKKEFASRFSTTEDEKQNGNTNHIPHKSTASGIPPLMHAMSMDEIKDENLENIGFTPLLRQVDVGLEMTELLKEVIRKYSKHQNADATKLIEIYGKMKNTYKVMDGMKEFASICDMTHRLIEETVKAQKKLADFLANDLVPNMTQHLQEKQQMVQSLKQENRQAEMKLTNSINGMKKAQKAAKDSARRAKQTADPTPRKKTMEKKKKGFKGFATGLKTKMKSQNPDMTEEEMYYLKADENSKAYEASVMTANHDQARHLKIVRSFKSRCGTIEESRLTYCAQQIRLFTEAQTEMFQNSKISTFQCQIIDKLDSLNAHNDFDNWVTNQIKTNGKWLPPSQFEFASFDYQNVFYSLEDAMKVTRKLDPDAEVPLMLSSLCKKVIETNGFKTEGIFRISASVSDLEVLRKQLFVNNYHVKSSDPHVAAGMLKEWLRGLKDSLIPGMYYNVCVDMAKSGKIDAERLDVFISQLPEVNRDTLRYLVIFLKKLLAPENTKTSKMNVENISIVFAPTVLRCPSDDMQTMMANSRHEKSFMMELIEKLQS